MTPQPINPIELAYRYNNLPEYLFQIQFQLREVEVDEIEEPEYENDNDDLIS